MEIFYEEFERCVKKAL